MIVNVTNTADISALESANAKLNKALGVARENIKMTERQRNENRVHEIAWLNTARTLSMELGVDFEEVKEKIFKTALMKTKQDFRERGLDAYKNPPQFTVKK